MTFEAFHSTYQSLCHFPVRKADTEKQWDLIKKGEIHKLTPTALLAAGFPPFKR